MIKKNKWTLLITSLLILLPMMLGVIFWDKLPSQMVIHWGADGAVDGMGGRAVAVFVLPCILLALHWLCVIATVADPKNKNQNNKMFRVVLWIMPVLTIVLNAVMYAVSAGIEIDITTIITLMLGVMFIILGNYLPKCKINSTMGIKLPWTLRNDENWNMTHRFGGRLWVIGGLLVMLCTLLPGYTFVYPLVAIMLAMMIIPTVYSYLLYRKQLKNGVAMNEASEEERRFHSIGAKVSMIVVPIILIGCAVLMLTGNVDIQYDDSSFEISTAYWNDLTVAYDEVESIEYREKCDAGVRVSGFGSARLMLGIFENEEFGRYTRYSYTGCESCVVLRSADGKVMVLTGADPEATMAIYAELTARLEK